MPTCFLRLFAVIWLVLGLAACKSSYQIAEPVKDSVHTEAPAAFRITYAKAPATLPPMTLNGVNVEQLFVAGATEAVASGSDLAPFLKEGQNRFHIKPPLGPLVYFLYDTSGPDILVLNASAGDPVVIEGLALDEVGTTAVTVNDINATVTGNGSFTVSVPRTDIYTFEAQDTLQHASTTRFAAAGQLYNPSLQVRANQSGIDFAAAQIINLINGLDLNSIITGTSLYDSTWTGPSGETYGADGFLDGLTLSASAFDLDLGNDNVSSFSGVIANAQLQLRLRLHNGLLPPTVLNIGATVGPINFTGNLAATAQNHQPVITLSDFDFNVGPVLVDNVPDLFQPLLSPIISGIANLFQERISATLETLLAAELPNVFAQIIQESYTIRLNDLDMAMALQLEDIATSDDSLLVTLSGGVTPITLNPLLPQPLGPLYTDDIMPVPVEGVGDFAVSVNANVINQTLVSAFAVGLTQLNIMGDTVHYSLPRNDSLGDEGARRLLVDTLAPPHIKIRRVNGADKTTLVVHGLTLSSQTKKSGQYQNDFRARINARVDISVSTNPDNTLKVELVSTPVVDVTGIAVGNGQLTGKVFNEAAETLVVYTIGQIMEQLAKPLGGIRLPAFGCMAFIADDFSAIGDLGHHAGMAGSLSKISDECDNPVQNPPKIAYGRGVGTPLVCDSSEDYDAGLCYSQCRAGYDGVGPVCWKQNASYGRGVGSPGILACNSSQDMDAGLCYPKCRAGFSGVGPVCWSNQAHSYGRGVGTIPNLIPYSCPAGREMDAGLCYVYCAAGYHGVGPVCWLDEISYGRGVGSVPALTCGSGNELDAGLCYPVCASGFHGVGPVCWTNEELSYGRGVGAPIHTCPQGKEQDAGLCYSPCAAGYVGVGPVCWPE